MISTEYKSIHSWRYGKGTMTKLIIPFFLTMLVMPAFSQTTAELERMFLADGDIGRLALQGNAEAQFQLGIVYELGRGVPQDGAEAVRWFRMAAFLGVEVRRGRGVPQDYAESVKWYRAAAEQGYTDAQFNLGFSYKEGRGVPQDYVQAHKWFNLATVGQSTFTRSLDKEGKELAVSYRDDLAKKMTREQIAEAQRLATAWKFKTWEVIRQELGIE